jgi:hypothetical protein
MRISDSTKTNLEFVNYFMSLVQQYNDQQTDYTAYIASGFTRTLLEASVADVGVLNDVKNRDNERQVLGGRPMNFEQYFEVLKSACITNDNRSKRRNFRRSVNTHERESQDPQDTDESSSTSPTSVMQEVVEYAMFQVMQKRRPSLNKSTWDSLSSEGKKTWDTMSDEDKSRITSYVEAKMQQMEVNVVETQMETEPPPDEAEATPRDTVDETGNTIQVNSLVASARANVRNNAHPADLRRSFGTNQTPTRSLHMVEIDLNPSSTNPRPQIQEVLSEEPEPGFDPDSVALTTFRTSERSNHVDLGQVQAYLLMDDLLLTSPDGEYLQDVLDGYWDSGSGNELEDSRTGER